MKGLGLLLAGAGVLAIAGCAETGSRGPLVAEPNACAPQKFDIYFREGEARLTDPALHAIGLTATQLQGCDIRKVEVVGLADASGGPDANLDLSERRALAVTEALAAAGWPAPAFSLVAAGESGSVAADGAAEPMRRRTEVLVEAAPR